LAVEALCVKASTSEFGDIKAQFDGKWDRSRGPVPPIREIWKVHPTQPVTDRFAAKCTSIGNVPLRGHGKNPGNQQRRFHGSFLKCQFTGSPCQNPECSVCCILREGFSIAKLGQATGNMGFFGPGHYSTSLPSTAHGYGTQNSLLVVIVAVGVAETITDRTSTAVSQGHDSRVVNKATGVDELMVPGDDQMLPKYLILF